MKASFKNDKIEMVPIAIGIVRLLLAGKIIT